MVLIRYYQVDLACDCGLWPEDGMCAMKECSVCECSPEELSAEVSLRFAQVVASFSLRVYDYVLVSENSLHGRAQGEKCFTHLPLRLKSLWFPHRQDLVDTPTHSDLGAECPECAGCGQDSVVLRPDSQEALFSDQGLAMTAWTDQDPWSLPTRPDVCGRRHQGSGT